MQVPAVTGINAGLSQAFPVAASEQARHNSGAGFSELMEEMVGKVSELQTNADRSIQGLATGENKGLHEVMLAVEKASISFQLLTQVRNKAVEAYQEIMRMQV